MSYILDALKRADSERERGQVPGLHARPLPAAAVETARRGLNPMLLFGAVVALGACAVLGWRLLRTDTAAATGVAAPLAQAPAPPQAAISAPVAVAAAPTPVPAPAPIPAPAAATTPQQTPQPMPQPVPQPVQRPVPAAAAQQQRAAPAPAPSAPSAAQPPGPGPGMAPAATAPASPEPRTLTLAELPPEIRSQLPALTISGATYSANPAHRMLIINGQVFHEGEKPAPELTLEQIQPKSVVLGFRGYRYSVSY